MARPATILARPLALAAVALAVAALALFASDARDARASGETEAVCKGLPTSPLGAALAAKKPVYLALGDSLALGTGATHPVLGYVPRTWAHLVLTRHQFTWLVNCGQSGAKSADLVQQQLPEAVALVAARQADANPANDVTAITVDIGGNDARTLIEVCAAGLNPPSNACAIAIRQTFNTFATNLTITLGQLRQAAPNTPIAVMTLFNPLVQPGCQFHPLAPAADVVLEGGGPLPAGLNDIIRQVAGAFGVSVAETFGELDAADLRTDCIHPDDSGYARIAEAYATALN
jgi:lysophospholipase L1-like esterase